MSINICVWLFPYPHHSGSTQSTAGQHGTTNIHNHITQRTTCITKGGQTSSRTFFLQWIRHCVKDMNIDLRRTRKHGPCTWMLAMHNTHFHYFPMMLSKPRSSNDTHSRDNNNSGKKRLLVVSAQSRSSIYKACQTCGISLWMHSIWLKHTTVGTLTP